MFANIKNAYGIISLWLCVSLVTVMFPATWKYGVIPRNTEGLIGILGSPFFHSGLTHLGSNLLPMYILGGMIGLGMSRGKFLTTTTFLIGASGILLWVFGSNGKHIGASGLVFAYFGYLVSSWWHGPKNWIAIVSIGVSIYLYFWLKEVEVAITIASMATVYMVMKNGLRIVVMTYLTGLALYLYWYLIPTIFTDATSNSDISWDGHLTGLIGGLIIGKFFSIKKESI